MFSADNCKIWRAVSRLDWAYPENQCAWASKSPAEKRQYHGVRMLACIRQRDRRAEADHRRVAQEAKHATHDIPRLILVRGNQDRQARRRNSQAIERLMCRLQPCFPSIEILSSSNCNCERHAQASATGTVK